MEAGVETASVRAGMILEVHHQPTNTATAATTCRDLPIATARKWRSGMVGDVHPSTI